MERSLWNDPGKKSVPKLLLSRGPHLEREPAMPSRFRIQTLAAAEAEHAPTWLLMGASPQPNGTG
jgi:hypothetical protein